MPSPQAGRALLTWAVFVVLLSGAGILAAPRDTGAFILSALMLCLGLVGAALLAILLRLTRHRP